MDTRKLFVVSWLFKFIPPTRGHSIKACLLRWAGAKIGKNVEIMSSAKIMGEMNLTIGNNCYIGHEAIIMGNKGSNIIMEDYSKIGTRVILVTGFHKITPNGNCIEGEGTCSNIRICKGAVVSTQSLILPGKTVYQMSHVAAGSVVTKDVPEFMRGAGVPARIIKDLREINESNHSKG